MNKSILSLAVALTLSLSACTEWGNTDHNAEQADTLTDEQIDSTLQSEPTITGVAIDGSRRNVFLQVDNDTLDFELAGTDNLTWEIGDTITLRFEKGPTGNDTIIHLIDVKSQQ